jgi:DNA-binding transcriptional LysR family regulator
MIDLDLYRVFYAVAKCGSLTKASEELYISQPAVSRSIKQLELQLGVSLFTRTHRGMKLSAQGGKLIFAEVEKALNLLGDAENRLAEMKNTATGTLTIGASDTIFEYFLADKIVEFHQRFPAVKIDLKADFTPDTIQKLKADECDVAFVNLPIEADNDLKLYGNFMHLNDIFITSEKYSELTQGKIPLSKLKEYPLIVMEKNTVARRSFEAFLQSNGIEFTPSIEVGSWDLMKRLVIRGMGVGIIPREYAVQRLNDHSLFEVKTEISLPVRSIGMLLPKNRQTSYALHCFIDCLKKEN